MLGSSKNAGVRVAFMRAAQKLHGVSQEEVKRHVSHADMFGAPDPQHVSRLSALFRNPEGDDLVSLLALTQGIHLLSAMIISPMYKLDGQLLCGRVETLASLCSSALLDWISQGIPMEFEPTADRILEKLAPWCENEAPLWSQSSTNLGLLFRVTEKFPGLQIIRSASTGIWHVYGGDSMVPQLSSSRDLGQALADSLTETDEQRTRN